MAGLMDREMAGYGAGRGASDADQVDPAIDVQGFAGGTGGEVARQVDRGLADILALDVSTERGSLGRALGHRVGAADSGGSERAEVPARDRVHADSLRAELSRQVAGRALQSRLGHAHDVVPGDDLL